MAATEVFEEIRALLDQVLQLGGRSTRFSRDTALLGSIPEFDSMAVVSVLTAIEESYGIVIDDDEISAEAFETVGSLADFVGRKLAEEA
ncbi:MAG: phosphopantetheine-binding protein [Nitrococcus sp.]|nr:phosphopantetheine-binding protein [Nitrococcus sp.]